MQIEHQFSHDVSLVYKTLTDPEFLKQRALSLGSLDVRCEVKQEQSACQIMLVQERQINVPSVLSAFVKKIQIATTNEQWQRVGEGFSCDSDTEIDGAPLSIKCSFNLVPNASGSSFTANFQTEAKIIFGKKNLQQHAEKKIAREIQSECDYTDKHLNSL